MQNSSILGAFNVKTLLIIWLVLLFQSWVFWDIGYFGLGYFGTLGTLGLGIFGWNRFNDMSAYDDSYFQQNRTFNFSEFTPLFLLAERWHMRTVFLL